MEHATSRSESRFQALLRIATASTADPPWFAVPIDAEEDDDAITVVFEAPERENRLVQIEVRERQLLVWERQPGGRRTGIRICSLPCEIDVRMETARTGVFLRVRMLKRPPTKALPAPSSST
jgi:HSP20 family molecular chaperone IbpA